MKMMLCALVLAFGDPAFASVECDLSRADIKLLIEVESVTVDGAQVAADLAAAGVFVDWSDYVADGADSKLFRGVTCRDVRYDEIKVDDIVSITTDSVSAEGAPIF